MSDIYLQITETPTVVTLSAPVISGALSSTVTVANTVTVALDSNSLSALENVTVTVGAAITGTVTVSNFPATQPVSIASVTIGNTVTIAGTVTANPTGTQTIAGTVTASLVAKDYLGNQFLPLNIAYQEELFGDGARLGVAIINDTGDEYGAGKPLPISGTVTIGSALPAGTNRIGVVTIGNILRAGDSVQSSLLTEAGSGYLLTKSTLNAGSEQIGSVTASISGTVPISISSVTIGNSVTIGSVPAISGTVTANTFALQGTAVTTSNFTSTTASTVLAGYNASRGVLTIFNEGAGLLFVCPGALCTTTAYQVRLSAGDYYEVPNHQTTITHSAVFATAGTARVVQVS